MSCERCGALEPIGQYMLCGTLPARLCLPCARDYEVEIPTKPEGAQYNDAVMYMKTLRLLAESHAELNPEGVSLAVHTLDAAERAIQPVILAWLNDVTKQRERNREHVITRMAKRNDPTDFEQHRMEYDRIIERWRSGELDWKDIMWKDDETAAQYRARLLGDKGNDQPRD